MAIPVRSGAALLLSMEAAIRAGTFSILLLTPCLRVPTIGGGTCQAGGLFRNSGVLGGGRSSLLLSSTTPHGRSKRD